MMIRITLGYLMALAAVALLADTGCLRPWLMQLHVVPLGDKVVHFLLVGTLALLVNVSLASSNPPAARRRVVTGTMIVTVVATLEECSNSLTTYRTFSPGDLLANYLGILCLGVVLPALVAVWRSGAPSRLPLPSGNM